MTGSIEATCMNVSVVFFFSVLCPLCQHLRFLNSKSFEETAMYLCLMGSGAGVRAGGDKAHCHLS